MYEFLCGEAPFEDTPVMTQRRIARREMKVPADVSPEARDLIEKVILTDCDEEDDADQCLASCARPRRSFAARSGTKTSMDREALRQRRTKSGPRGCGSQGQGCEYCMIMTTDLLLRFVLALHCWEFDWHWSVCCTGLEDPNRAWSWGIIMLVMRDAVAMPPSNSCRKCSAYVIYRSHRKVWYPENSYPRLR